jgi:hypothetical protein
MRFGRTYELPCCWCLVLVFMTGLSDDDLDACKILIQISLCVEFRDYLTRGLDMTISLHSPSRCLSLDMYVERFFNSDDDFKLANFSDA